MAAPMPGTAQALVQQERSRRGKGRRSRAHPHLRLTLESVSPHLTPDDGGLTPTFDHVFESLSRQMRIRKAAS